LRAILSSGSTVGRLKKQKRANHQSKAGEKKRGKTGRKGGASLERFHILGVRKKEKAK